MQKVVRLNRTIITLTSELNPTTTILTSNLYQKNQRSLLGIPTQFLPPSHKPYLPPHPRSARGTLSARPLHRNAGQLLLHLQNQALAFLAPHHHGALLRPRRHGAVHPRHELRAGEKGRDHRRPDRDRLHQKGGRDHGPRSEEVKETGEGA